MAGRNCPIHENLYRLPGHLIRRLQQAAVSIFMAEMDAAGQDLTPVQFGALTMTCRYPGIDQATLAGLIAYDRATIGKVVDRLARKKLLVKSASDVDRRSHALHVTEIGASLLEEVAPQVARTQELILSGLEMNERVEFMRLLRKATDALSERKRPPLRVSENDDPEP